MIREALAGLPTRPVMYLAAAVLVLGLGYHFATAYSTCTAHAALRESLQRAIEAGASGAGRVRLAGITDFAWDRAEILVNYKPEGRVADCPFQWDWSREVRRELIAADLLTVIVFLHDGKLADYLELRSDSVEFVDVANPYTPESAVFDVSVSPGDPGKIILKPAL